MKNATPGERIKQKFADIADAALSRGYGRRQLYQLVRDGKITAFQVNGGKLLIDLDELDAFIRSKPYDPKTRIDRIVEEVVGEVTRG